MENQPEKKMRERNFAFEDRKRNQTEKRGRRENNKRKLRQLLFSFLSVSFYLTHRQARGINGSD